MWFDAFRAVGTPDDVRVCILGQDPYHGPGQANGLAFSVAKGMPIPPSLRNIYKEIARDCGGTPPAHGDLNAWARQGVLLLNDVLSVEEGNAGSHSRFGWQEVTQSALAALDRRPVAFLLWGRHARSHRDRLAALHPEHLILEAAIPVRSAPTGGSSGAAISDRSTDGWCSRVNRRSRGSTGCGELTVRSGYCLHHECARSGHPMALHDRARGTPRRRL